MFTVKRRRGGGFGALEVLGVMLVVAAAYCSDGGSVAPVPGTVRPGQAADVVVRVR